MKVSVIICTYRSPWEKLQFTLDSILSQTLKDYEIIICDDGSDQNNEKQLRQYFAQRNFSKYLLLLHQENRGTVQNFLSGLRAAKAPLAKGLGAGDALAGPEILEEVCAYMESHNTKCLYGNMLAFSQNGSVRRWHNNISIPAKKAQYTQGRLQNMKENIIVFNDQLSGAGMFYDTQYIIPLLEKLGEHVIYVEDLVQYMVLLSGNPIAYHPKTCVLYEIGTGLSTQKTKANNNRMLTDKRNFLEFLIREYGDDPLVKRRKTLEDLEQACNGKLIKGLQKTLAEPKWLLFRITRR